jgi:Fic family protein
MDRLIEFINQPTPSQYDLIKIAMAHHAFTWIHPFDNGNGRTVRVLTYALMLKYGFKNFGIVMNPTAVFCADRHIYYDKLQAADTLTNEGVLVWCSYVLAAVKTGYDKTVSLADHSYVQNKIIKPSFQQLVKLGLINTSNELQIMEKISTLMTFKKSDILEYCNNDKAASRKLTELRERNFIELVKDGGKLYQFNYNNRIFLRVVAEQLAKEDMLPRNVV